MFKKLLIQILKKIYLSPLKNKIIMMLMSSGLGLISIPLYSLNATITYNGMTLDIQSNDNLLLYSSIIIGLFFIVISLYIFLRHKEISTGLKFLSLTTIIDINDNTGKEVKITEYQIIKSLEDNKLYIIEPLQTDGHINDNEITVSSGQIEQITKKENIMVVKSSFKKPLKKGEIIRRKFKYIDRDSFVTNNEYWVRRVSSETKRIKIIIKFPYDRPYKTFKGLKKYIEQDFIFEKQPKEKIINNRQCLIWVINNPKNTLYSYRLEWTW